MKNPFARVAILPLLAAALTACAGTPPPTARYAELTYGHLAPISLDIARIEVVAEYKAPVRAPNVDHLFPVQPVAAAMRWGKDRLRPVGANGVARLIVTDAKVIESALPRKGGLTGAFTTEQTERYDATLEARLEIRDENNVVRGYMTATATESTTVGEDATVNDRERTWYALTEKLMGSFNAAAENNIRQYLATYVR